MTVVGTFGLPQLPQNRDDNLSRLPKIFLLYAVVAAGGKQYEQAKASCTDQHKLEELGKQLMRAKKCIAYRISSLAYVPTGMSAEELRDYA